MKQLKTTSMAPAPNNLPPRMTPFVNRKQEIQAAFNALRQEKVSVVALTGIGGIGKTSLALEIAHYLLEHGEFPGGIVWLSGRNLQSIDDLTREIAVVLGVPTLDIVSRMRSQRCLVIFDGLDEIHLPFKREAERFVETLPAPSKAIVTSRNEITLSSPKVVIGLGVFTEEDARELLQGLGTKYDYDLSLADQERISEIVRILGYHPLALTIAANIIQGKSGEALAELTRTIEVLSKSDNERERAALLHTAATIEEDLGNYPEARQLYQESLRIAEERGDLRGEAAALHQLAFVYTTQGDLDSALRLYYQSLAIDEQLGDLQGKSATLNNMAQIFATRGDLDGAMRLYQQSLAIKEQLGDLQGKSATLNNMAQIFATRGDLDGAMQLYQQSLAIKEQLGDLQGKAAALHQMAGIFVTRGDLDEAMRLYQQSLAIGEQLGDLRGKSATLNNMAQIFATRGDLDRAMRLYRQSLAIGEQLGDLRGKSATLNNMAQIFATRGDLDRAMQLYQQSLAQKEQLGDLQGLANVLVGMGQVLARNDPPTALEKYQRALQLYEQIGDRNSSARALYNLGSLYKHQGNFEKAIETFDKSQDVFISIGLAEQAEPVMTARAEVDFEFGKQLVEEGRWYDALRLFNESLTVRRQGDDLNARADTIYQIARTHHLLGNLDKARIHYRDALRLYERTENMQGLAACRTALGRLMIQMGFVGDAVTELDSAKRIYRQLGDEGRIAEVEQVLSVANHIQERQPA